MILWLLYFISYKNIKAHGPDNEYLTKDRVKYIINIYVNYYFVTINMNGESIGIHEKS